MPIVADSRAKLPKPKPKSKKTREDLLQEAKSVARDSRQLSSKVVSNPEKVFKAEYDRMLRYNSLLIRKLNEQLNTALSSRDIYALSTLMSQQREVINDLRAMTDMSGQVEILYSTAVNPFVSDLTQLITDVYYQLRKLIMETTKPKETPFALSHLDELVKQMGLGVQNSHQQLRQSIEQALLGTAPETVKPKKRKKI